VNPGVQLIRLELLEARRRSRRPRRDERTGERESALNGDTLNEWLKGSDASLLQDNRTREFRYRASTTLDLGKKKSLIFEWEVASRAYGSFQVMVRILRWTSLISEGLGEEHEQQKRNARAVWGVPFHA
jgi:hypothetical protein